MTCEAVRSIKIDFSGNEAQAIDTVIDILQNLPEEIEQYLWKECNICINRLEYSLVELHKLDGNIINIEE